MFLWPVAFGHLIFLQQLFLFSFRFIQLIMSLIVYFRPYLKNTIIKVSYGGKRNLTCTGISHVKRSCLQKNFFFYVPRKMFKQNVLQNTPLMIKTQSYFFLPVTYFSWFYSFHFTTRENILNLHKGDGYF